MDLVGLLEAARASMLRTDALLDEALAMAHRSTPHVERLAYRFVPEVAPNADTAMKRRRSTAETRRLLHRALAAFVGPATVTQVAATAEVPRSTAVKHLRRDPRSPSGWRVNSRG